MPRSLTITIGRNVGSEPMTDERWTSYRDSVRASLPGGSVVVDTDYVGSWAGESEDAHVYVVLYENGLGASLSALDALRREYAQDAIGWSVGDAGLLS